VLLEESEGGKREGESCWKSGGLAGEASSDAIPDTAVKAVTGLHGVIHRYILTTQRRYYDYTI
jgi:hypothetical protein